jgi:hypothetical protein
MFSQRRSLGRVASVYLHGSILRGPGGAATEDAHAGPWWLPTCKIIWVARRAAEPLRVAKFKNFAVAAELTEWLLRDRFFPALPGRAGMNPTKAAILARPIYMIDLRSGTSKDKVDRARWPELSALSGGPPQRPLVSESPDHS